jgi:hypothetical protein
MHSSSPEEAIYRLSSAAPLESQEEIRFQLAETLNWIIVQQLVHVERAGFRVPLLSIVKATKAVKNIIRENKLNQLHSVVQIGKSEGMFTPDRYMSDYLNTLISFIPYSETFHPSALEVSEDINYQSPLTNDLLEGVLPNKPLHRQEPQAPVVKPGYGDEEEVDRVLRIDDDASLLDLLKKTKK